MSSNDAEFGVLGVLCTAIMTRPESEILITHVSQAGPEKVTRLTHPRAVLHPRVPPVGDVSRFAAMRPVVLGLAAAAA